jgi:hypothetical protein
VRLEKEMEIYDTVESLDQWLTSHAGMVLRRDRVYWGVSQAGLREHDYSILLAQAKDIASLARAFCPHGTSNSLNRMIACTGAYGSLNIDDPSKHSI